MAQWARARDTPQGAVPAVTGRAISIPDIRTPPAGKCQYDPKHMRATSDAYQGIIYQVWDKQKYKCRTYNYMYQIKSATFVDSDVHSLNTTMAEGPPTSSSTRSLRTSVCYPSIRLLTYIVVILSANLCSSSIYNKNSILDLNKVITNNYSKLQMFSAQKPKCLHRF